MSDNFEESFQDFFFKMTFLNYMNVSKIPLNEEWKNIKKTMSLIIPIFNRISSEEKLSLDEIITVGKPKTEINQNQIISNDYPFINEHSKTTYAHTNTNTITPHSNDKSNETNKSTIELDIEGDKQVEELHKRSLEKLEEYIKLNILLVEEEEDDDEVVSTESIENDDGADSVDTVDSIDSIVSIDSGDSIDSIDTIDSGDYGYDNQYNYTSALKNMNVDLNNNENYENGFHEYDWDDNNFSSQHSPDDFSNFSSRPSPDDFSKQLVNLYM